MTSHVFPEFMEPDSSGPVSELLVAFLNDWAKKKRPDLQPAPKGRGQAGQATRLVYELQKAGGIPADGGFGRVTRTYAREEFGFDLEAEARALGEGQEISRFVQPDSEVYAWTLENGTEIELQG